MDAHQQDLVAQFCAVTDSTPDSAQNALTSAGWNLQEAVALYFAANEPDPPEQYGSEYDEEEPQTSQLAQPTPAQPSASSSSRKPPTQRPKQMTLDDLKKMQESDHDSDDSDKKQDMYAGGEKSGLAVANPGNQGGGGPVDHFKNIMNQARQNRDRPAGAGEGDDDAAEGRQQQPQQTRSANFGGRAQTLGGDDAPSQVVEDPAAAAAPGRQGQQNLPRVARTLHLWADGVSIDDGPLFRFDDPANAGIMQEINRGRAPLALLDVQPDQEVDLNLEPHKDEKYVQPKKKWKPFGGSGQRLGSPTPGPGGPSAATTTTAAAAPSASASTAQQPPAVANVDDSQPTLQLQIRLGDGTRLSSRFNTTHTIGDVYSFVDAASPASSQRPYALMTTFPSKELDDRGVVLGDMGEFKRGGVVVQKWK
ncbi:protein phosphatase regulator [Vermiconidia calcicola]|uniref:Protein phosphatase regulator n=1 Tax=Vermiconidia calcicola TaxID=1690605 RepID=A0ACC3MT45_9PEZI|nr:protein phosphatase regulator [Vermiconidia calcicola]